MNTSMDDLPRLILLLIIYEQDEAPAQIDLQFLNSMLQFLAQ